jgi:hypothetical protein
MMGKIIILNFLKKKFEKKKKHFVNVETDPRFDQVLISLMNELLRASRNKRPIGWDLWPSCKPVTLSSIHH